jgi:hypothetical protein
LAVQFAEHSQQGQGVRVTITDRMAGWRRERRVLQRVSRVAWRLAQAERERAWALASACADGVSIRKLEAAAGLPGAGAVPGMVVAPGVQGVPA